MTGLQSMTGHGRAQQTDDGLALEAEVRSVNNRFLKVTYKLHESLGFLENQIEGLVREKVRRGSVHVSLRVTGGATGMASMVSVSTLKSYLDQTKSVAFLGGISIELGSVLQLPGVLLPNPGPEPEKLTALALSTIGQALDELNRMRQIEGGQMAKELIEAASKVRAISGQIEARAPNVLIDYRKRLESRVRSALAEMLPTVGEIDVLREVVQFSDRCDIREEIVRLYSHLDQFLGALSDRESQGRRLDFLIQEIARETNTIGAKANDATIAHGVVSIKTTVEQMRELVQNVE
ncbi:MAG: YicC family protein [Planctomycetota bacterium]|nr:YicC family protein [Planctomycetota bacterium]